MKPNKKFVKTENQTGGGLMALATKKAKTATAKKDDKEIIKMDGTVSDAIDSYIKNKKLADEAAGEMAAASEIIKSEGGKKVWIAEMEKTGKAKESFILASQGGNSLMYVVTDAYKRSNLDEERVEYLQTTYGEGIISTDNKFIINPELIDKYGQVLCDMIKSSKLITDADKETLIQLEQKHVIAKGTKDNLKEIAKQADTTVEAVFEEIQPTCQIKVRGSK